MESEVIIIPAIQLQWSRWTAWNELKLSARSMGRVRLPHEPGVYEVKYADAEERLTIGKASSLRMRIKQGLVKGNGPHSTGITIRATEDVSRIVVRWAETDRPAAVEEELHQRYKARFGTYPKHTKHT